MINDIGGKEDTLGNKEQYWKYRNTKRTEMLQVQKYKEDKKPLPSYLHFSYDKIQKYSLFECAGCNDPKSVKV